MGFMEILTIIFVIAKLAGAIDWAWWLVLLPEIIAVALYIVLAVLSTVVGIRKKKKIIKKLHNDTFKHF